MSTPPKRSQWREELQNLRRDHGFSKKVLLNCCLVRRAIAWAAPNTKGRSVTRGKRPGRSVTGRSPPRPSCFLARLVVFVVDVRALVLAKGSCVAVVSICRPLTLRDAQILYS